MSKLQDITDGYHQDITASLKLLQYNANPLLTARANGSFSVLEIKGESGVSTPYSYEITFISDESIDIEDIVDTEAQLNLSDNVNPLNSKKIYGKVYEAKEASVVARKKRYTIKLVSPLHYLSLNQRYEIYQNKPVVSIIQEVIARYESLLNLKLESKIDLEKIPSRAQCTQYEQSDLEFITMLCEEEGYIFLCDASINEPYTITLCELSEHARGTSQTSSATFNTVKHFHTSAQDENYYDSTKPSLDMRSVTGQHVHSPLLGDNEFTQELRVNLNKEQLRDRLDDLDESKFKDLQRYAQIDSQRGYSATFGIEGSSDELFLTDGLQLTLNDEKANKSIEAILLHLNYDAYFPNALDEYKADQDNSRPQFSVSFIATPKDIVYKPPVSITKPRIQGLQSAIVSGGDVNTADHANEIDVNNFGEIRVIFHFDKNRPTSCYVPLSNMASGDGYGTQFLPRVNSEVLVSFINGDIDRPVIIGTLHNGENRQAYNLPKEKSKSFIKTQSMPQYEDEEGYNELLFEDKRGEEELNLRAQRDFNLNVLNDANVHVQNNLKTVVDTDSELTVQNDYTQTIGNTLRSNVTANAILTVEGELINTVKMSAELHLLQSEMTIVNQSQTTIIEQALVERIKGSALKYVEKDAKQKYLANLFTQVGQAMGIEVTAAYSVEAASIKLSAETIALDSSDGISLVCGGNVLTVDASGIGFKTPLYDSNAAHEGVASEPVAIEDVEAPLYEKLRVIALEANLTKQSDITDVLVYTAKVEKFEAGEWVETTDLSEAQLLQLQWYFIKNSDETDDEVLTDNLTDDLITIDGLSMTIDVQEDNIEQFGHAHCFVISPEAEQGHVVTALQRQLDVQEVLGRNLLDVNATEANYRVQLNIDNPTPEEIKDLKVEIHEKDESGKVTVKEAKVEEELTIKYEIEVKEKDAPKVVELRAKVYPKEYPSNSAEGISYIRPMLEDEKIVNARPDNQNDEYINSISDEMYTIRADTSLEEGTEVTTILNVIGKDGSILATVEEETYVENQKVEQEFDIEKIIKDNKLVKKDIKKYTGKIQCQL